jgi:hypothetical protein
MRAGRVVESRRCGLGPIRLKADKDVGNAVPRVLQETIAKISPSFKLDERYAAAVASVVFLATKDVIAGAESTIP